MAYDKMKWHYDGDYQKSLLRENAGTYIWMFLAWCFENNLVGELHLEDNEKELQQVKTRQITDLDFLIDMYDETFCNEDLNDEECLFALFYYMLDDSPYLNDYRSNLLGKTEDTMYHVENSLENYDKLKPLIDKRFKELKALRKKKI